MEGDFHKHLSYDEADCWPFSANEMRGGVIDIRLDGASNDEGSVLTALYTYEIFYFMNWFPQDKKSV
jgi:hypothetical protein